MKRQIIKIDEDKCTGCGDCIPNCHEGALQLIDGKCRLISELFCDGLGACIGHCPEGAITIEEREAQEYDEIKVLKNMLDKPKSVLAAHLEHLKDHNAHEFLNQAIDYLKNKKIDIPMKNENQKSACTSGSCPGSKALELNVITEDDTKSIDRNDFESKSRLGHWPVQLHLVNENSSFLKNSELVIMSTCGPVASANVHKDYLDGRAVVIACPKLDYTDPYSDKLTKIFQAANTSRAIVVRMEVPCCSGLTKIVQSAADQAGMQNLEVEEHILGIRGKLKEIVKIN